MLVENISAEKYEFEMIFPSGTEFLVNEIKETNYLNRLLYEI